MVGGEDARKRSFFCGSFFMKEQVSNQEKSIFYLNSKQGAPVATCPLPSPAALYSAIATSIYGMKVFCVKDLPCKTLNNSWRLINSPVLEEIGFWWRQQKLKLTSP